MNQLSIPTLPGVPNLSQSAGAGSPLQDATFSALFGDAVKTERAANPDGDGETAKMHAAQVVATMSDHRPSSATTGNILPAEIAGFAAQTGPEDEMEHVPEYVLLPNLYFAYPNPIASPGGSNEVSLSTNENGLRGPYPLNANGNIHDKPEKISGISMAGTGISIAHMPDHDSPIGSKEPFLFSGIDNPTTQKATHAQKYEMRQVGYSVGDVQISAESTPNATKANPGVAASQSLETKIHPAIGGTENNGMGIVPGIDLPSPPAVPEVTVFSLQTSDRPPAANPINPAQPLAVTTPHDFSTLVDRLTQARETVAPHFVRTAIMHSEFGRVSLEFRHSDAGLIVTMANPDPSFEGAVQAGIAATSSQSDADGLREQARHAWQHTPQPRDDALNAGNSQSHHGFAQNPTLAGNGMANEQRRHASGMTGSDGAQESNNSSHEAEPALRPDGLYA